MFHDFCLTLDLFEHSDVADTCITLECYLLRYWPSITLTLPLHSTLSSPLLAFITFILRLWHEKQRPTRLLLIFRSLAQVTLMHASSALQLTLGHAQTGGCTRSYFMQWRGLPVVLDHIAWAFDPNLTSLSLHSSLQHRHVMLAPEGETQALSRYGLIPNGFLFPIADSSLLRHWLSHHLRSWVDRRSPIAPYPRISRNSIPSRIPL